MSRTPALRWEWTLANGAKIAAELDPVGKREVAYVAGQVASESTRGARPEGHVVVAQATPAARYDEPLEATLTFEAGAPICILRVDGHEVAPTKWPLPQPRGAADEAARQEAALALPRWLPGAGVVAVLVIAAFVVMRWTSAPKVADDLTSTHRAENGLFIAHYPRALAPKPVVLPAPLGGVLFEDDKAGEALLLAAFALDGPALDGWALQQRFHDEVLASFPKTARTYLETERREDRCLNEAGAVIVGKFDRTDGARARIWSCAFVKDGRGYFVAYALPEAAPDARLRRIVDGTELTKLARTGATP